MFSHCTIPWTYKCLHAIECQQGLFYTYANKIKFMRWYRKGNTVYISITDFYFYSRYTVDLCILYSSIYKSIYSILYQDKIYTSQLLRYIFLKVSFRYHCIDYPKQKRSKEFESINIWSWKKGYLPQVQHIEFPLASSHDWVLLPTPVIPGPWWVVHWLDQTLDSLAATRI